MQARQPISHHQPCAAGKFYLPIVFRFGRDHLNVRFRVRPTKNGPQLDFCHFWMNRKTSFHRPLKMARSFCTPAQNTRGAKTRPAIAYSGGFGHL